MLDYRPLKFENGNLYDLDDVPNGVFPPKLTGEMLLYHLNDKVDTNDLTVGQLIEFIKQNWEFLKPAMLCYTRGVCPLQFLNQEKTDEKANSEFTSLDFVYGGMLLAMDYNLYTSTGVKTVDGVEVDDVGFDVIYRAGDERHAMLGYSLADYAHLPVRPIEYTELSYNDASKKGSDKTVNVGTNLIKLITLGELIGGFLYEITFYGNIETGKEFMDHLEETSRQIDSGEVKTFPIELMYLEITVREADEGLFSSNEQIRTELNKRLDDLIIADPDFDLETERPELYVKIKTYFSNTPQ